MTKDITREDIGRLNTAQLIALCQEYSVGYADKATQSKKTNDAKRKALWDNLPKTSEMTQGVKDAVWAAMLQLKSGDKMDRFEWLLRAERKQCSSQVGESPKSALQTVEETAADEDMLDGQATPEKQEDERRKRSKDNTPQFKIARPPPDAISQERLDLRHAVSASLQFVAAETVDDDWAAVVHHLGPALQQCKVVLQKVLGAVEADRSMNRH